MKHFICAVLIFVSMPALAKPRFRIGQFEFGGIRIVPEHGINTSFIDLAWTPMWDAEDYGFHGTLEATWPKDRMNQRFMATAYMASAFVRFFSLMNVEGTAGMQTYHSGTDKGTNPIYGIGILMRPGENLFDRVYISYYWYKVPGNQIGELRVGSAFTFF